MTKKDIAIFRSRVMDYLTRLAGEAYEQKDEVNFDWYGDGYETFFQVLCDEPIVNHPRIKPL